MERDQLVESLEQRIADLEIQKENLAKELEPWTDGPATEVKAGSKSATGSSRRLSYYSLGGER